MSRYVRKTLADPHERMVARFAEKFAPNDDGCWIWLAGRNTWGYATFHVPPGLAVSGAGVQRHAHRVAYELLVGPVPDGLELDHLCRVRHCVNPWHLEPVTRRENLMRGETLARAHFERRDCGFAACPSCASRRAADRAVLGVAS